MTEEGSEVGKWVREVDKRKKGRTKGRQREFNFGIKVWKPRNLHCRFKLRSAGNCKFYEEPKEMEREIVQEIKIGLNECFKDDSRIGYLTQPNF